MSNWADNFHYRVALALLLLACLSAALALCANVSFVGVDVDSAQTNRASFSFDYHWHAVNVEYLSFAPVAIISSLCALVALCVALPFFRAAQGVLVTLGVAVVIIALFLIYPPIKQVDDPGLGFGRLMVGLAVTLLIFLLARAVILFLRRRKVNGFLRQYIPSQLFQHYMQHPDDIGIVGESRNMTIMFCDIKRFTAISERLDPELLPEWLNRYFDAVSEVVVSHGGTVDKYIGDCVMAFWGAPVRSETHAHDALRAAREILLVLETLSDQLVAEGWPPMAVGIGVSTGYANVGHLGSRERMTYTVVGDAVNTADRLQRCTSFYNLSLVVNDTATENVPEFLFRELDTVHVKGRQRFVRIFQPVCHQDEAIPNTHRKLQLHRKAMQFYRRGMWEDAETLFRLLSEETQEVAFYKKYIERMVNIRLSEPTDGTNYIVDFTQKIG